MPERESFEYAIIRIVPRVEREEFLNVGVILLCRARRFLEARVQLDPARLDALAPGFDARQAQEQLDVIARIVAGDRAVVALGALDHTERFRWLTAPRSAVVQMSAVHCGVTADPRVELDTLFREMIT